MNCDKVKKKIPLYIDNELQPQEAQEVKDHLAICSVCRKETEGLKKQWDLLLSWKEEEPAAAYVSRVWTKIAEKPKKSLKEIGEELLEHILTPNYAPVFATLFLVFALAAFHFAGNKNMEIAFNKMNVEEVEVVTHIELAEHFEIIADIETLEDFDVIESLDIPESKAI